jgi:hypothetical protein
MLHVMLHVDDENDATRREATGQRLVSFATFASVSLVASSSKRALSISSSCGLPGGDFEGKQKAIVADCVCLFSRPAK